MSKTRRRTVRIALFAFAVLVLSAEIGLRWVFGNMAQTSLYTLSPSGGACVGLAPGLSVTYTGWFLRIPPVLHEVNLQGYRGDEPMPGASPRIAFFGDSFVYGQGVTVGESLPAQLQTSLRRQSAGAAVVNLGVPGFNLEESVDHAKRHAAGFNPDLLLLALVHNDLEPSLCSSTGTFPPGGLLRGSYSFRGLFYAYKMVGGRYLSLPEDPAALDAGLAAFRSVSAQLGVRPAVVVLGSPLRRLPPGELENRLNRSQIPWLNAHTWLEPGGLPTIAGEGHLDPEGNRVAAERLGAWLLEQGLL